MNLLVDDERGFFFQPCFSVVWDTAIAAYALGESGEATAASLERDRGLAAVQGSPPQGRLVRQAAGSSSPRAGISNSPTNFIPTSTIPRRCCWRSPTPTALMRSKQEACTRRAVDWLLAMQGKDGGWAAFDVDNNWEFLSAVPFRGSQRDARSDLPGYHRTRSGSSGRVRRACPASGGSPRRRVSEAHAGSGRKLVRPLGRELHLRHVPGAARPCRPPARAIGKRTSCAPANGCGPFRTPTEAGARAAPATTI